MTAAPFVGLMALALAATLLDQAAADFRAGRYAEAETKLRRIVRASPRSFDARFLLGAALVETGRHEEAVQELRQAHALRPGHGDALKLLASELLGLHRPGEAIALVNPEAWAGDEELLLLAIQARNDRGDAGDVEAALAVAERALRRFPESGRLNAWMGHELREAGRFAEARRYLERSLEMAPEDPFAGAALAGVYLGEGNHEEARKRFDALLRRDPANTEASLGAARALAALGRIAEAVFHLEAADPGNPRVQFELSRLYARAGQMEKSRAAAERFRAMRARDQGFPTK